MADECVSLGSITIPDSSAEIHDYEDIFCQLMQTSIADTNIGDSIYSAMENKIRTIEISDVSVSDGKFSETERTKLIAMFNAKLVPSMTNVSMKIASAIVKEDVAAGIKYSGAQADVLVKIAKAEAMCKKTELIEEKKNAIKAACLLIQAELKRDYGVREPSGGTWAQVVDTGEYEIDDTTSTIGTTSRDELSSMYYTLSRSFREYGSGDVSFVDSGAYNYDELSPDFRDMKDPMISGNADEVNTMYSSVFDSGLMSMQTINQMSVYDAFDYNKQQHAVNSANGMIGAMVTAGGVTQIVSTTLNDWIVSANVMVPNANIQTFTAEVDTDGEKL